MFLRAFTVICRILGLSEFPETFFKVLKESKVETNAFFKDFKESLKLFIKEYYFP